MERKAKAGVSAFLIMGIVFSVLGGIYLIIGILFYFLIADMLMFSLIFGGVGAVFFVLGVIFLILEIRKRALWKRLLNSGNYIVAQICEVQSSYNINVNGRHPFTVKCQYQDIQGNVHIFKSRNLYFNPTGLFKDENVKVYVEGEDFRHYYVDIDEVLPRVIEH